MTPDVGQLLRQDRLDLFWWFITERQMIWARRYMQHQAPPWTEDAVLATNRFTNVYRELDPGTVYAIEAILETQNPVADRIFNLMLYRLIGRLETHRFIGFQKLSNFSADRLESRLKVLRDVRHETVFTAAYMVSGYTSMGSRDKVTNVCRLFAQIHEGFDKLMAKITAAKSPEDIYLALRSEDGMGNFLAYQVLVDMLYPLRSNGGRPLVPFSHDDWAAAGPGAQAGIKMLLKEGASASNLDVMRWLWKNQEPQLAKRGLEFPFVREPDGRRRAISLANIQNCLCEFHKYVKISDGTGRARRKFAAAAANKSLRNFGSAEAIA